MAYNNPNAKRCDHCGFWEPKPRGADTMAGLCQWKNSVGISVPVWADEIPRMSADRGNNCMAFVAGRYETVIE